MTDRYMKGGALLLMALSLAACKEKDFKVEGNIEGGADRSILLEKADFHGRWIVVDSTKINSDGKFEISAPRPSAPDIYRLALDDRFIYLPVDSTETLSVTGRAENFGSDFTVTGTPQAERMAQFEQELMKLDFADKAKRDEFKRNVYNKYLKDAQGAVISYYVLTKVVGDEALYDITDPADAKYYAAVATSYRQYRPQDPHAEMIARASLEAMKKKNSEKGKRRVVEAEEVKMIDIELPDEKGNKVKLSETVGKGKSGVMIVSMMNEPESPAVNKALSDLYASKGNVTFYMVSLDEDLYGWREGARNLPWTTVVDPGGRHSSIITKYNVGALPAFFIYDGEGNLVDRAMSIDELKSKL